MELRSKEIDIPKTTPFVHDLLHRKQYADVLTQIVKNTENGFTLSINADWGYGKTTFVKMWEASLQNEGYKTIYFNEWESDFVADPMIALIDGIINGIGKTLTKDKKNFISALSKSLIQLGKLVPGLNAYAEIADAIQNGTDKLSEEEACLKEYRGIKSVVDDFRDQLATYAKKVGKKKSLIIFVDELDRCRPNYAVQMLERIKHFFVIDNIIFVLSVDKKVISESIKTVYGDIDVAGYLRRFVDLEFDLPEPDISNFIDAQFEQRKLAEVFTNYWDNNAKQFGGEDREVKLRTALSVCLHATSKSLRDIEKYFNRLGLMLSAKDFTHKYLDVTSHLLYLYMFYRDIYSHLLQMDLEIKEMWFMMKKQIDSISVKSQSKHYRLYKKIALRTLAVYGDAKEQSESYKHEILREDPQMEWLSENDREWFKNEISNHNGELLKHLGPYIELLEETFTVERLDQ